MEIRSGLAAFLGYIISALHQLTVLVALRNVVGMPLAELIEFFAEAFAEAVRLAQVHTLAEVRRPLEFGSMSKHCRSCPKNNGLMCRPSAPDHATQFA
jgi:hypothetical protein